MTDSTSRIIYLRSRQIYQPEPRLVDEGDDWTPVELWLVVRYALIGVVVFSVGFIGWLAVIGAMELVRGMVQ